MRLSFIWDFITHTNKINIRGPPPLSGIFGERLDKNFWKLQESYISMRGPKVVIHSTLSEGIFMGFLEFQGKKFSPFFSETGRPIGLKFFLQQLEPKWGVYFFFFWKIPSGSEMRSKILETLGRSWGCSCCEGYQILQKEDFHKPKKIHTPKCLKYLQKKFQPDRPTRFREKGGKLQFLPLKIRFEKNAKYKNLWFFSACVVFPVYWLF